MKLKYLLPILILFLPYFGFSQNVLDGVYVKKPEARSYRTFSGRINYHNVILGLSQSRDDTSHLTLPSNLDSIYGQYSEPPLKIKGCVFFNPIERFISSYSEDALEQPYFYLNTVDYGQKDKCFSRLHFKTTDTTESELDDCIFYADKKKRKPKPKIILPNSMRYYIDIADITTTEKQVSMKLDTHFSAPFEEYLTPFYFRKYEVTNTEYREFVQ